MHSRAPRFRSVDIGPSEHAEQARVIAQRDAKIAAGHEEFRLLTAIPNYARGKTARTGAIRRAEGLTPGMPDLVWLLPRAGFHGLAIEMKRIRRMTTKTKGIREERTKTTEEQDRILALLRAAGYLVAVCYTGDEAWDLCLRYWRGEVE